MQFLDISGLLHLKLYAIESNEEPITLETLRSNLLRSIFYINNKFKNEYGQMIICKDSKNNWRKQLFPNYKIKRKESREADDRDWQAIFKYFDTILDEVKENIPIPVIEVEELEADDLIALCSRLIKKDEKHIILSSDKDMMQLLVYPNITQWSLVKQDFVIYDQSKLKELILKGDSSDGVPNIYSSDNIFLMEGVRQKSVTSKMLSDLDISNEESITNYFSAEYDELSLKDSKEKDESKKRLKESKEVYINNIIKNINRNKTLIDLTSIPEKYNTIFKEEFIKCYNIARNSGTNTRNYLMKHYLSSFYYNEQIKEDKRIEN